jgi:uncharacterized iron-regulated membrane protein
MKFSRLNRKIHFWGSIFCVIPTIIIIVSGLLLLLRKDIAWIQPVTNFGQGKFPTLEFSQILDISKTVEVAQIKDWQDVSRLDVRPKDGIIKILAKNNHEIQVDFQSGEILQVAKRRSGIIEEFHDGSFFHKNFPLAVFFPSSLLLLLISLTGIYIFIRTILMRR